MTVFFLHYLLLEENLVGEGGGALGISWWGFKPPCSLYRQKLCQRISKYFFFFLIHYFGIETTNTFLYGFFFPRKPLPIQNQNEQSVCPFLDRKSAKTISFGVAHTYVAYSVFKRIFPGRESKYRKNSVRRPECPLNASFVRDMHFEKERIDLKG